VTISKKAKQTGAQPNVSIARKSPSRFGHA
jgi:hypothetical protein